MADQNLAVRILIRAFDRTTGVLRGITRGFRRFGTSVTNSVTSVQAGLASILVSLGLIRASTSAIGAAASLEDLQLQFEAIEGSAEAARAKLAELESSFGLQQVEAAQRLYADLAAFGFKPAIEQVKSLIDFNAKLSKGQENLSGITAQLGQAWSKQKLQLEDIIVLMERGVPVWDLLSAASGQTAEQLSEMASKGELGRKAIAALVAEMGKVAAGASTRRLTTWNGLVESASALWQRFLAELASQGAFQYAKEQLAALSEVLIRLIRDGTVVEWGRRLGEAMRAAGEDIRQFVTNSGTYFEEWRARIGKIANFTGGILDSLKIAWNTFASSVNFAGALVTKAMDTMLRGLALGAEGLAKLGAVNERVAVRMRVAQESMAQASADFANAGVKNFGEAGQAVSNLAARFETGAQAAEDMAQRTTTSAEQVAAAGQTFSDTANKMADSALKVRDGAQAAGQGMADLVKPTKQAIIEVGDLEKAFERLGITSQAKLAEIARNARDDFETIRTSGTATAQDIEQAFLAYAQTAITSGDTVELSISDLWARVLNLRDAYKGLKKTTEDATKAAVEGHKQAADAAKQQANAVDGATAATPARRPADVRQGGGARPVTLTFEALRELEQEQGRVNFISPQVEKEFRDWLREQRAAERQKASEERQKAEDERKREEDKRNAERMAEAARQLQQVAAQLAAAGSQQVVVAIDGYEVARAIQPHQNVIANRNA